MNQPDDVREAMEWYGHVCDGEHSGPRWKTIATYVAELEASKQAYKRDAYNLLQLSKAAAEALDVVEKERDRLQDRVAELEQVSVYCETLTQRCVEDTAEIGRLQSALSQAEAQIREAPVVEVLYGGLIETREGNFAEGTSVALVVLTEKPLDNQNENE